MVYDSKIDDMIKYDFKIGDIVKMDLDFVKKFAVVPEAPPWYSEENYIIIDGPKPYNEFDKSNPSAAINVLLYRNLPNCADGLIWSGYLKLDIIAMRRNKLERLNNV